MDELLQEFIAETRETLEALTGELIAWEKEPADRDRLDSIFRFFHTVKGSCGFLDLPRFARLSHAAEDVLSDLRDGTAHASTDLVSAVLAVVDRIAELTEALETGEAISDESDDALISALRGAEGTGNGNYENDDFAIESDEHGAEQTVGATENSSDSSPTEPSPIQRTIRIPLQLLDKLMNGVSDLVLARNEVSRQLRDLDNGGGIEAAFERLSGCVAEMRDSISKTRMQRIERLFSGLPRLVRDISNELGKNVDLDVHGNEVEIDREMIEMIRDPLTHIVRNSIDHGLEGPDERKNVGKMPKGKLVISARQSGNQILIEIADDGRGIDVEKLVAKAVAAKVVTASAARSMSQKAMLELIFSPGLSTADTVSKISGRGVGMDVVRSNIERIGGLVEVENEEGEGLSITLRVPLTLTIIAGLTIQAGDQLFALPRTAIQEILRQSNENVRIDKAGGAQIASVRGKRMPHIMLETILGLEDTDIANDSGRSIVIVHASSGFEYALNVAGVIDHEELVIKPGTPLVMGAGVYAGMTLPNNGKPMLLLDASGIAEVAEFGDVDSVADNDVEDDFRQEQQKAATALLFVDLQQRKRAIRLNVIDRVEDIDAKQLSYLSDQMLVEVDGKIWPVFGMDDIGDREIVNMLRLTDGASTLYFAVEEVLDMLILSDEIVPVQHIGLIEGVTMLAGAKTEMIDAHWLFAEYDRISAGSKAKRKPLCCLKDSDDPWTKNILVPLVESAGYEVIFSDQDVGADVVILAEDQERSSDDNDSHVVRLRSDLHGYERADESVYRYDRVGLLTALQSKMARGA